MANNHNQNGDNDLNSLIPIAILLCIPTVVTQLIAIAMLIRLAIRRSWFEKLGRFFQSLSGGRSAAASNRAADWEKDPWAEDTARTASASSKSTPQNRKKAKKVSKAPGTGLIIGGAITTGIFTLGTAAVLIEWLQSRSWSELTGVISCAMFLAGGLIMLFSGIGSNRERERFAAYLAYIGANREVDLARMAANLDVPVKKLCKDLRKMLSKGILPTGYVDLAEGKLFLTEMGYQPTEPKRAAPEPEPAPAAEDEDAILKEIRQVNDFIPDAAMTEKIDRIEEITRKILAYQKKHPERAGQLRSFLNYYLPTTLKILRAYAQLDAQGVEGENISAAKGRIEGMMDQVVYGFEKQLDKLFQEDAMDVAADVEVLENMLKKDGLSGGEGLTLEI